MRINGTNRIVRLAAASLLFVLWTATVGAQISSNYNFSFSMNRAVPDDNLNGMSVTENISGVNGPIGKVTVSLNLANGFNGDLYAYLRGPNGGFAVLLNRTGVTGGDDFGYGDTGFNMTFNDAAANNNIHFYQDYDYNVNLNGQLMGNWSSDGRAVDPQADPATLATTQPTASLNSFDETNPNGTWTLFLSDTSAGGQSTLKNLSITIQTVPEPSTWTILCGAAVVFFLSKRLRSSAG